MYFGKHSRVSQVCETSDTDFWFGNFKNVKQMMRTLVWKGGGGIQPRFYLWKFFVTFYSEPSNNTVLLIKILIVSFLKIHFLSVPPCFPQTSNTIKFLCQY